MADPDASEASAADAAHGDDASDDAFDESDEASDRVLETLKPNGGDADDTRVNDGIGARPRLNWSPVTDSGGDAPPRRGDRQDGGFSFNLGTALAKLGLDPDVPVAERAASSSGGLDSFPALDRRPPATPPSTDPSTVPSPDTPGPVDQADPMPVGERTPDPSPAPAPAVDDLPPLERRTRIDTAPAAPALDPLPRRSGSAPVQPAPTESRVADVARAEPAPVDLPERHVARSIPAEPTPSRPVDAPAEPTVEPASRSYVAPRRSVFDDVVSPSPQLPPTVVSQPGAPAQRPVPSIGQANTPTIRAAAPTVVPAAAPVTPAPVLAGASAPFLPTLPAAAPVAVPAVAAPVDQSASQNDIRALRSAQLRATRQRRTGKVVVRAFLILLLIAGLVGAALMFGRDVLFPTDWDPALTSIVDEIEVERGAPFEHTVGLVQQSESDFDLSVVRLTIGDAWTARVPEWRALGLATGNPTAASVAGATRSGRLAIYDANTDRIYLPDGVSPADATDDLRLALEQAYDAQLGAVTVPEPTSSLAGVSASPVIARRAIDQFLVDGASATVVGWQPVEGTPAPIQYELLAADVLGASLLDAVGVDPAAARFGTDLSTALVGILDDDAGQAEAGALQVGERSLAEPVALGNDDWSLVWGMRLPRETVDQMGALVHADSYRPIDRHGVTCVVGVFETATAPEADIVLVTVTSWVTASPLESQATATRLSETRVQLVTCDPGADIAPAPSTDSVAALVERQLARLAAA